MELDQIISAPHHRALWKEAPIGIAICDAAGRIRRNNTQFGEVVGYSQSELAQRRWQDITHPHDADEFESSTERLTTREGEDPFVYLGRYLHKLGQAVWVKSTVFSIWESGKFSHFVIWALPVAPEFFHQPDKAVEPSFWSIQNACKFVKQNPRDALIIFLLLWVISCNKELIALLARVASSFYHLS